jgi:hypothetical protein
LKKEKIERRKVGRARLGKGKRRKNEKPGEKRRPKWRKGGVEECTKGA